MIELKGITKYSQNKYSDIILDNINLVLNTNEIVVVMDKSNELFNLICHSNIFSKGEFYFNAVPLKKQSDFNKFKENLMYNAGDWNKKILYFK